MKNFKDTGFRNKGKDFGGRPKFTSGHKGQSFDRNNRFGDKKELFSATCSSCHKSCEVPFRPSADKPVYCSACFNKRDKDNYQTDNTEFKRETRPVVSNQTKPARPENTANNHELSDIKRQLVTIEARLNRILDIINPPLPATKTVVVEKSVAVKEPKSKIEKMPAKKTLAVKKVAKKTTKKAVKKVVKKAAK